MATNIYKLVNFGPAKGGLATVGYKLTGGSRITAGVAEVGTATGIYGATVAAADGFAGSILWDTGEGSPAYAADEIDLSALPSATADALLTDPRLTSGTAAAVDSASITLEAGTPVFDRTNYALEITSGPGVGKVVRIVESTGLVCEVETLNGVGGWGDGVQPTDESVYRFIGPASSVTDTAAIAAAVGTLSTVGAADDTLLGQLRSEDGTCQAGSTSTTIKLASTAPTVGLVGAQVTIVGGLGAGQARRITAYASPPIAIVTPAWGVTPDATSKYRFGPLASVALAADSLDHVEVESGVTLKQALQRIGSATAGVETRPTATTVAYAAMGNTGTTRVTSTINAVSGVREAVVYDA